MTILLKHWKLLLTLILITGMSVSSYFYGRNSVKQQEKVVIQEKIVTVEVEKKTTNKEKTTTTTKKPDGSETTIIIEKEKSESTTSKESKTEKLTTPKDKKYRVGVFAETKPKDILDKPEVSYGLSASAKIISDLWLDGSYNLKTKSATLGVSWEF